MEVIIILGFAYKSIRLNTEQWELARKKLKRYRNSNGHKMNMTEVFNIFLKRFNNGELTL